MSSSFTPRLVLITVSSRVEARALTQAILDHRLAACVNIVPGIESHYWWNDKLDHTEEFLLLVKSSAEQFEALSSVVREKHSYECPEIIALAPEAMSPAYRAWWEQAVGGGA